MSTICAISTPPGVGGIAVIRVSGPQAVEVADRLWKGCSLAQVPSHTAHLGTIVHEDEVIDEAVATVYRAPRSFTGEDVVELSVHGSIYIQQRVIQALIAEGIRLAEPGEFTRRAFSSGRLDLAQAEGVADLIASRSAASHRLALSQMRGSVSARLSQLRQRLLHIASMLELELDFSEEDVEFASRTELTRLTGELCDEIERLLATFRRGQAIRDGVPVAIVGPANAGKSSLLNVLVGDDRAIVSDIPGTTRDIVEDTAHIADYMFRFIDTAGIRHTSDRVESLGIERSHDAIARARIVIAVIDASMPVPESLLADVDRRRQPDSTLIVTINKSDISQPSAIEDLSRQAKALCPNASVVGISALSGHAIDDLRQLIVSAMDGDHSSADIVITNQRHADALADALASARRTLDGLRDGIPGDLVAQDLRATLHHLAVITGSEITTPEILASIFSHFCIGK